MSGKHTAQKASRKKRDGRDYLMLILALVAIVAVLVAVWAVSERGKTASSGTQQTAQHEDTQSSAETTSKPIEKLTDGIDLPGYSSLSFRADTREQTVTIPNPPQNFCWIRASLLLEDGTLLWTSDLIAPGESSDPIVFSAPLSAGEYKNAVLKYECFLMDEAKSSLNGASTKLTLKVS